MPSAEEDIENQAPTLETFDMELKIAEWEYELDSDTKAYKKPKLPFLSDNAIKPFLNPNIKSPKLTIYQCPFCARVFTYSLPFKSHLYTCVKNENVPAYCLRCPNYPACNFMGRIKSDVFAHFSKTHTNSGDNDGVESEKEYNYKD